MCMRKRNAFPCQAPGFSITIKPSTTWQYMQVLTDDTVCSEQTIPGMTCCPGVQVQNGAQEPCTHTLTFLTAVYLCSYFPSGSLPFMFTSACPFTLALKKKHVRKQSKCFFLSIRQLLLQLILLQLIFLKPILHYNNTKIRQLQYL